MQVSKKSSIERLPTMEKYSDRSIADDASHTVIFDRAYKRVRKEDQEEVPPQEVGKAYMVGVLKEKIASTLFCLSILQSWSSPGKYAF